MSLQPGQTHRQRPANRQSSTLARTRKTKAQYFALLANGNYLLSVWEIENNVTHILDSVNPISGCLNRPQQWPGHPLIFAPPPPDKTTFGGGAANDKFNRYRLADCENAPENAPHVRLYGDALLRNKRTGPSSPESR